jgi:Septum formation
MWPDPRDISNIARGVTDSVKDGLRDSGNPVRLTCARVAGTNPNPDGLFETITVLRPIVCAQPHDGEFVGTFQSPDSGYPPPKQRNKTFSDGCFVQAARFLGLPDGQWRRDVSLAWLEPSSSAWTVGDRTARCYLCISSDHLITTWLNGLGTAPLPPKAG